MITTIRRKMNAYFLNGDETHWTDEAWYYGSMVSGIAIAILTGICVY